MTTRVAKMSRELTLALLLHKQLFIKKFGREPLPTDPIFFDPTKDVPTRMTPEQFNKVFGPYIHAYKR